MSLGGFFKGLGKGIAETVYRGPRGIVRIAKGDFRKGLGDIGFAIKRGAQAAALLGTGGMAAPALIAAGGGMLEGATKKGAGFKSIVGGGVSGAAGAYGARGLGDIGRAGLARIGTSTAGSVGGVGGGGAPYVPGAVTATSASPVNPGLLAGRGFAMPGLPQVSQLGTSAAPGGGWLSGIGKGLQKTGGGIGKGLQKTSGFIEGHPTTSMLVGQGILASQDDPMVDIAQQNQDRLNEQWALEQDPQEQRRRLLESLVLSGAWRSNR